MELSAKLVMLLMVYTIICVGAAVSRSIHKSSSHHGHHHRVKGSHRHSRVRYHLGGHRESKLVDMEQAFMDMNDPRNQDDGLDDHPIAKRHNEEFRSDVKDLQNCAVCNYTVSLFPKSEDYEVPEDLIEVTCNEASVGGSCSNTGLDYICMQTFSHIKFAMKGNPGEFTKRKINTGCVCALREIDSLRPKEIQKNYY